MHRCQAVWSNHTVSKRFNYIYWSCPIYHGQIFAQTSVEFIKGTGAFASKENKSNKTFREEYIVPYSLIGFMASLMKMQPNTHVLQTMIFPCSLKECGKEQRILSHVQKPDRCLAINKDRL